jgi:hypothetical protein
MPKFIVAILAVVLILHGLIHLMGTTVYMKLGRIEGLPYKTTLLGGRWQLGEPGMRVFGALWVVPAVGFILGGAALLAGLAVWTPLIIGTAVISLILTGLDWKAAYAGAILSAAILVIVWLGPIIRPRLGG